MRGDVHRLRAPRNAAEDEPRGERFAVILQADDLMLSTVLVAPTSTSAAARIFRPTITIADEPTQVLTEQAVAIAPERLGEVVGRVSRPELEEINTALRLVLELD